MLRTSLHLIVFALGLTAALWIGIGYVGHNAIGAAVALLIAACYAVGGLELLQFRRSTDALRQALASTKTARDDLAGWLQTLPAHLRGTVRLRVEGSRIAFPGPALTPYLVGLLVLLGMLGTLLGMMATLRGTGLALQSATDLQAIRGSLASPVEGLAVAFGTSIAGVAASAMLGLLSALLRRERQHAVQALDERISSELQVHGHAWQRTERLRLMQDQSTVLPSLVQQLQALVEGVQQANANSHAQLHARQETFISQHEAAQERLAGQIEASLQRGVQAGSEAIGATLQPLLRDTLARIESSAARTHATVSDTVQRQLDGMQDATRQAAADASVRIDAALAAQHASNTALLEALSTATAEAITQQRVAGSQLLDAVAARLEDQQQRLGTQWSALSEAQDQRQQSAAERSERALQATLEAQHASASDLLAQLQRGQQDQLALASEGDAERLQRWSHAFDTLVEQAGAQWQAHASQATAQQQRIGEALEKTAHDIAEDARRQSTATLAEITRLLESASEAPRAAAEVVAELRQRLSDSLVRDTSLLEERAQLLGTLGTLMESIQATSSAQRMAVDGLIENAATLMQQTGAQFGEQVDAQAQTLQAMVSGMTEAAAGTRELAGGLENAVDAFAQTSGSLSSHLQQLAAALDASLARSDEQLAYYVSQAREVVDLSLLSQKQITEELRQLGDTRGTAGRA